LEWLFEGAAGGQYSVGSIQTIMKDSMKKIYTQITTKGFDQIKGHTMAGRSRS